MRTARKIERGWTRLMAGCAVLGGLAGCTTGVPTSQPADAPLTEGACSDRAYSNAQLKFGFNPPEGFVGPIITFGGVYPVLPLLSEEFIQPLITARRISLVVFNYGSDLNSWIEFIRAQRLIAGSVLFSTEDFVTEDGIPATFLIWSTTSGAIYEVFAEQNGTIYAIEGQFSLIDAAFLDPQLRTSFHSLCIQSQPAP